MKQHQCLIGILGGIASGKSTLARIFETWGATLIDADKIGHRLLDRPDVRKRILETWGEKVLKTDGSIDRGRLGSLVFGNKDEMDQLSKIIHPPLLEEIDSALGKSDGPVVIDAALLDEFSLASRCNRLIFLEAGEGLRRRRAQEQRGWLAAEVAKREAFQNPLDRKRKMATLVIRNDGSLEELKAQAKAFWDVTFGRREE